MKFLSHLLTLPCKSIELPLGLEARPTLTALPPADGNGLYLELVGQFVLGQFQFLSEFSYLCFIHNGISQRILFLNMSVMVGAGIFSKRPSFVAPKPVSSRALYTFS